MQKSVDDGKASDISYVAGGSKFNYRVCGIMIRGGSVLAMRDERSPYYYLPGGRVKMGETAENAIVREIKEELGIEIKVDDYLTTIEYDYPKFHLSMDCFFCHIEEGSPTLLEHEAARWLSGDQLEQVDWLPADLIIISDIKERISNKENDTGIKCQCECDAY